MSIVLDGTTGITTPGLTNTGTETLVNLTTTGNTILGDASTDTLNVGNGGLIKDASGNLGLGVTPSAWGFSGQSAFQVKNASFAGYLNRAYVGANNYTNSGGSSIYIASDFATNYVQASGQHQWYTAASGTAGNAITFTQAMTLDASGNLGIANTDPTNNGVSGYNTLVLGNSASTAAGITLRTINSGTPTAGIIWARGTGGANGFVKYDQSVDALTLGTAGSERARIDSSGRLLVGAASFSNYGTLNSYTNSSAPAARFVGGPSTADGTIALMVDKYSGTNTTSQWFLGFTISNQTTASGVITANGASQAAFGSWSDRRLKENIVDLPPQLDNIMALRPVEFDYIESEGGGHQISFIAQEFEEVYPDAIGERSDGMKTLTGWSKTEARLVKAIQEQQALIQTLTDRITALENK